MNTAKQAAVIYWTNEWQNLAVFDVDLNAIVSLDIVHREDKDSFLGSSYCTVLTKFQNLLNYKVC